MLTIVVPKRELFNDETQEFIESEETTLELEHSLVSLSKWEQIYEKPFLGKGEKTNAEVLGYVACMLLDPEIPLEILQNLSEENVVAINSYIDAKMSATWFRDLPGGNKNTGETITAELIYYWLFTAQIPIECENWHLNRLFTLIKVFGHKNAPQKKMSRHEQLAEQSRLNAERQKKYNSTG